MVSDFFLRCFIFWIKMKIFHTYDPFLSILFICFLHFEVLFFCWFVGAFNIWREVNPLYLIFVRSIPPMLFALTLVVNFVVESALCVYPYIWIYKYIFITCVLYVILRKGLPSPFWDYKNFSHVFSTIVSVIFLSLPLSVLIFRIFILHK